MKNFKEWLSDYLRYILLFLAGVLFAGIVWIGVRVYQRYDSPTAGQNIEIIEPETDTQTEKPKDGEKKSESETQSETSTESETESEAEKETGKNVSAERNGTANSASNVNKTAPSSEGAVENDTDANAGNAANAAALAGLGGDQSTQPQTQEAQQSEQIIDIQPETQAETQPPTEPEPVYMTLNQACNFRSGPGYDYEVVAEYSGGTVVEYLGMVEGWAEVQIDGMIGYMGKQFLG